MTHDRIDSTCRRDRRRSGGGSEGGGDGGPGHEGPGPLPGGVLGGHGRKRGLKTDQRASITATLVAGPPASDSGR